LRPASSPTSWVAPERDDDLGRLAARSGITLRQLSTRTHSLEDVFFQLTGTDAGLRAGQEMGAIK
jgi:hypothetical protein